MAMPTMPPPPAPPKAVPPLENGDHLTREEFERRFDAMPNLKKAELIEGVVYMPSPVRHDQHGRPHADLITWLNVYKAATPGVSVGAGSSVRLDMDNEPQPDGLMIVEPDRGGRTRISIDGYIEGGPEFAGEISASTVSIDLNKKLQVYRRNSVLEYLVWRVLDSAIDWFVLRQSRYDQLALGQDAIYRSEVFPGLWLDPAALTRFDMATVLQVLQRGLASPEHEGFVARLRASEAG